MSAARFRLALVLVAAAAVAVAAVAFALPVLDERSAYDRARQEQRQCEREWSAGGMPKGNFCTDDLWPELR
jgi:hypothetical protein